MPKEIPIYSIIPFVFLILSIAILPLLHKNFWESNWNKLLVSITLSLPAGIWLFFNGFTGELAHILLYDYLPFIILISSLFVITGGIYISGNLIAKPHINVSFLVIGAILSSFIGTTGAALLLIRPLIETNKERNVKVHTILFFLAIVANTGGLLTPLGDPPLFMMYLRGVSFFWFLHLLPEWLFVNSILILLYYFIDRRLIKTEQSESLIDDKNKFEKIHIHGAYNLIFMLVVILSVAFLNKNYFPQFNDSNGLSLIRELVIFLVALLSLSLSKKERANNRFSWHPVEEVTYIFLGIFITMLPCVLYLSQNSNSIGISSPIAFYYITGFLSSFLDNAPTAVTMHSLAKSVFSSLEPASIKEIYVANVPESIMSAISTGAVFFGSLTYIGNGPNFMIKAIAESEGINMPHFFSYIFKFSLLILLPIYILAQILFIK